MGIVCGVVRVGADREWICRVMIGDWQDEWDLERRGSDRSVNRHDTCRGAAYLNKGMKLARPVQIAASQLIAAVKEDIWNLLRCCVRMGRARVRR